MPYKKHSKQVKKDANNNERNSNEERLYSATELRYRRTPVKLFEFLGPKMRGTVQQSNNNQNNNISNFNTGNLSGNETGGVLRILSGNEKEPIIKQMTFKANDDEFPTIGSMRAKKTKQPSIVAASVEIAAGNVAKIGAQVGAAVEANGQAPKPSILKPNAKEFSVVGPGSSKSFKQKSIVTFDLKPSTAPEAAAAVVQVEATAGTAPDVQGKNNQQHSAEMPRKPFHTKNFNPRPGLEFMERQAGNLSTFNPNFRRVPQAQIHAPYVTFTQQSAAEAAAAACAMNRSPSVLLDMSRPPPSLPGNLPMNRSSSLLPPCQRSTGFWLDTSRPPPPLHIPRPQQVVTPHSLKASDPGMSGCLSGTFTNRINEQVVPPLQSKLNHNAAEFRPRLKAIAEPMPESNVEPPSCMRSLAERRMRQRFHRTLKPHALFEVGELPLPAPLPQPPAPDLPLVFVPLGGRVSLPNFANMRSPQLT